MMKVNELSILRVDDVALGGKALARLEGRAVFVDRGLPGDLLEVRVTRVKRTWAEARLERVVESSPLRRPAPCPHAARCCGCRFQDLAPAEQARFKERQVRETLVHLGGIAEPRVLPIVEAPEEFHYRNKMEFTIFPDAHGVARIGLHERGFFDRSFALEDCLLPSALTVAIVRATQRVAEARRWSAWHPRRHEGVARHLVVRHLPLTGECAVNLVATADALPGLEEWAREIAALDPAVTSVTLGLNRQKAAVAFNEETRVLAGRDHITERLLGLEFTASANAFLQTNSRQAEHLYAAAIDAAGDVAADTVLDLYCGAGTLTLLFARAAREAVGVESVTDAVAGARRNAERNGIANARFVEGDARRVLRAWARGERDGRPAPGVVVVDPPRAGLHPRVVTRVTELRPRRVVYVSCNPATLARDAKDFAAQGYVLDEVRPFDMFPHTPHIECVARLERAAG
jgi:23S rRNA (uracil1939-C5)-methyltransferase